MAPIRVGLIGLSAQAGEELGPGSWGVTVHLRALTSSPKYELVAVCNSSVESAQRAIETYKLPSSTKAYGSPEDIAKDPNVDLVVVSVFVGKHFELAKPALLQKKNVFVEWPLGASLEESQQLTDLAKQNGVKTAVGVQFRADPLAAKLKEILQSGKIGQVTSSILTGASTIFSGNGWPDSISFYLDWKTGGNEFHIGFAHILDTFVAVLGDFQDLQATLTTAVKNIPLVNIQTGEVTNPSYTKTSPDHTLVQGTLESGAVASISYRRTKASADGNGVNWIITGTEGEVVVTLPDGQAQFGPEGRAIKLRVGDKTETVDFENAAEPEYVKIPGVGTNIARVYEAFSNGDVGTFADFETALKTHKLLDRIAKAANFPPA